MVERQEIIREKVLHSGFGSLKDTYLFAHDWFKADGFLVVETKYEEKLSGDAKEINIEWVASKDLSDYFRMNIIVKWKILAMTEVEVEVDGKRKKMNKFAELSFDIKGLLEKDYRNDWNTNAMQNFFKSVYNKYVIPKETMDKERAIVMTVQEFKEALKAFIDLTGRRQ